MSDCGQSGELSIQVDSPMTAPTYYSNLGNYVPPPPYHASSLHCTTNCISITNTPDNIRYAIEHQFINELIALGMSIQIEHSVIDVWSTTMFATAQNGIKINNMEFLHRGIQAPAEYVVNCQISAMDDGATHVRCRKISGSSVLHRIVFKILGGILDSISDPESTTPVAPLQPSRQDSFDLHIDPDAGPIQSSPPPSSCNRQQDNPALLVESREALLEGREAAVTDRENVMDVCVEVVDGREVLVADREVAVEGREVAVEGREVAVEGREVAVDRREVVVDGREIGVEARESDVEVREAEVEGREMVLKNDTNHFNLYVRNYYNQCGLQRLTDISATIMLCSILVIFWN